MSRDRIKARVSKKPFCFGNSNAGKQVYLGVAETIVVELLCCGLDIVVAF